MYEKKVNIKVFPATFELTTLFKWVMGKPYKRLFIATYTISKAPMIRGILEKLSDEVSKGKKVIFVVNSAFSKIVYDLRGIKGINWVLSDKIHSKIIMADNGRVILGSGNVTVHIGKRTVLDVMVAIEDKELYNELLKEIFIPVLISYLKGLREKYLKRFRQRIKYRIRKLKQ